MKSGRTALFAGILVAACALAYHNSLGGPFIFDDHQSIEDNPHAKQLWPLTYAMSAPPASGLAGRPIVSLSIAINYAIGGLNVTGYHVANLLFHVVSALLLFGIARRTLRLSSVPESFHRDADWLALMISLLWAVHPLLTESVTYIIQRTELLVGMFFLATLYCFIRGATTESRSARTTWYVATIVACALGMGSKEVMVTAPLVVLIYDRLFLAGGYVRALRSRWPIYVGLACTLAIIPALLLTSVAWRSKSGAGIEGITIWDNLKTQADVIVHYLRLAVWPSGLAIDYDDWPIARSLPTVLPQALLVLWFLGLTVYGLWRGHPLAFLGAWFFVILAPTSSFLPLGTEIAGERRMYLPTIAVVALAVIVGRDALTRLATRFAWRPSSVRLSGSLAAIAGACALIGATVFRNDDYRTALSIYSDAARKRPGNARAMMNVGVALAQNGDNAGARQAFEQALERKPNYPDAHYNVGAILFQSGDADAALPHFAAAIKGRPTWPLPYYRIGEIFALKGQVHDAQQTLEKARSLAAQAGQQYLVEEIDAKIASLPSTTTPREPA